MERLLWMYSLCVCAYILYIYTPRCLWECVQCVLATVSTSFLLQLQSVEVMKINERKGGGRLRSRYCLPVSSQSSIDPLLRYTLPASDKGSLCVHTHSHTLAHIHRACTDSHKDSLMHYQRNSPSCWAYSLILVKELILHQPPLPLTPPPFFFTVFCTVSNTWRKM